MSQNPQPRKGIHDRETPQREGSHQEILANEDSISSSESDEECPDTGEVAKKPIAEHELTREASRPPQQNKQKSTASINVKKLALEILPWKWVSLCLILFGIVAYYYNQGERSCSFENFQKEYPKETAFKNLQTGIEMILNKKSEKPAVYLLAHHGKNSSDRLINKIAQHSSGCFGKALIPMKSADFEQDTGSPEDYGYAIEKYKSKIKEGNVFLIANLNKIPAKAARALHTICDTHSPISKNVVIFLSLTIDENKKGNPHSKAEQTLEELWGSEIGLNELDPLITRVTDQVIILKS